MHVLETFYCKVFLLEDVQNLNFCFPVPAIVSSTQDNGFLEISPLWPSVFDNATPPASSYFVNAHRTIFSTGKFNYTGLPRPVPSRLNIPVWRALLQDYEDRIIFDFLVGHMVILTKLFLCLTFVPIAARWLYLPPFKNISVAKFLSVAWQDLSLPCLFMAVLLSLLSTRWPSVTLTSEGWSSIWASLVVPQLMIIFLLVTFLESFWNWLISPVTSLRTVFCTFISLATSLSV